MLVRLSPVHDPHGRLTQFIREVAKDFKFSRWYNATGYALFNAVAIERHMSSSSKLRQICVTYICIDEKIGVEFKRHDQLGQRVDCWFSFSLQIPPQLTR